MGFSTRAAATKAPVRKPRGEGHTRRDEILAAAQALFLEQGVRATTIRRIAERVGVSAPALYLYFKDKDAILLELCDRTFERLMRRLEDIERLPLPAAQRLRRMGEAYVRFGLEHPDEYWITFIEAAPPEEVRFTGHRSDMSDPEQPGAKGALTFAKIVGVYQALASEGVTLPYPADTCAELSWMACHGLVAALITKPDFPWSDRETLIRGMVEVSVRGIVPTL
ncbi:MAG: TetR/AcrR family transcriptional regulator [Alphaproteobacteria bacterium]|nr:TetR/AcrR family transcriptional regulator [Alphaproteobacteria bacterium]